MLVGRRRASQRPATNTSTPRVQAKPAGLFQNPARPASLLTAASELDFGREGLRLHAGQRLHVLDDDAAYFTLGADVGEPRVDGFLERGVGLLADADADGCRLHRRRN